MPSRILAVVLIALAAVAGGCQRQTQPVSLCSSALQEDAMKTSVAIRKIGQIRAEEDIPSVCWAERITALHPLKVYAHRVNLVVVQKLTGTREEGLYIYIPISSYLPHTGVDGFEFVPDKQSAKTYGYTDGADVWHYTRNRTP